MAAGPAATSFASLANRTARNVAMSPPSQSACKSATSPAGKKGCPGGRKCRRTALNLASFTRRTDGSSGSCTTVRRKRGEVAAAAAAAAWV